MRKLENVIEEMISVSENKDFNNELLNIKNSISLTSPELMGMRWNQVHEIMLVMKNLNMIGSMRLYLYFLQKA
ncbi:hypothetical protein [Clostridium botulinum]|uniref:hypothetical protein n=1 Tax=Clostridium botulinum TaxID=1491 RepID=UPI003DA68534